MATTATKAALNRVAIPWRGNVSAAEARPPSVCGAALRAAGASGSDMQMSLGTRPPACIVRSY
jgi:hypothetical protein